jgi:hypothetical protein
VIVGFGSVIAIFISIRPKYGDSKEIWTPGETNATLELSTAVGAVCQHIGHMC